MQTSDQSLVEPVALQPADVQTDVLVIPATEADDLADLPGLDAATGGEISRARTSREFRGKANEVFLASVTHPSWKARRVALVGLGTEASVDAIRLATAALAARQRRIESVALQCRRLVDRADEAQAAAEGLVLADFDGGRHKTGDPETGTILSRRLVVDADDAAVKEAVARGTVLAACTNLARQLGNEPSNLLTPRILAERAVDLTATAGLETEVLDERAIADLDMGLLLGVARGSAEPPRLIVVRYTPPGPPRTPVLGLVGKGVTFDTGGISIKPAEGMDRMKDDMAGGAAVICALRAIAILGAPIAVIGVVPATENMPGGRAIKPGDVLRAASGRTVEVSNTDAEGRLILGDALWYARRLGATHLVDVATLTGACVVALGKSTSGLFGRPDDWVDAVRAAARRAGDRVWPMPLFDDYREQLRSEVADIGNSGGRPAGAITAAIFLKEFAGDGPWTHLDIAGTAWADEAKPYRPKGPTGVAVRTLANLALMSREWGGAPEPGAARPRGEA
jgi:leucyl aminopeptidase